MLRSSDEKSQKPEDQRIRNGGREQKRDRSRREKIGTDERLNPAENHNIKVLLVRGHTAEGLWGWEGVAGSVREEAGLVSQPGRFSEEGGRRRRGRGDS